MKPRYILAALLIGALILASCSNLAGGGKTIAVTGLSLSKSQLSLVVGATESLVATVTPSNATNASVTWSSSAPGIATVSDSGAVKGIAAGSATITASCAADSSKNATCSVTVSAVNVPVSAVSIGKHATMIAPGKTLQLSATVEPAGATDTRVTWSSSATGVATVSDKGLVTAVAAGSVTITACSTADASKSASCSLTVSDGASDIDLSVE